VPDILLNAFVLYVIQATHVTYHKVCGEHRKKMNEKEPEDIKVESWGKRIVDFILTSLSSSASDSTSDSQDKRIIFLSPAIIMLQ
jgi:hypothetical protein